MNPLKDAFISYGRADSKQFAKHLMNRLVETGYTVWFDFEDIPLGVDYQKQIDDGIDKADNFLFLISPHAVNSPYCHLEIEQALSRNKHIIPLLHVEQISQETWQQRHPDGTDEQWAEYQAQGLYDHFQNMHPVLRKINWVYMREGLDDFEVSFAGLLELLERHKSYVRQHTVLLDRALTWERNQKQNRYLLIGSDREQAQAWLATRFTESQPPCLPTDLQCEFITESIKNANNLMTEVFLCHADEDRESAEQIRRSLLRRGMTVWNYRTDIQTSQDYHTAIAQGIESTDNVLFMLSPHSAQSAYCQRELAQALALQKRIIPILAAPIDGDKVPEGLQSLQQIDLTDNVDDRDYLSDESDLLKILNTDAAYHTEHKIWLTQALKWERQHQNPTMLLRGYNLRRAETWLKVARTHHYPPTALHEQFIAESLRQPPDSSLDVFISYSRVDSDFARKLNDFLQRQGKRTWFDQESIASGADFQQEIYRGIESSDHFLFILSPNAVNSPYCADEVEYAAKLNKRIVTVRHRAVESADLHPVLAKVQWIDFQGNDTDFAANFQELIRTLDTDPEHLRFHTRLLLQAITWDERGRRDERLLRGEDLTEAEQWLLKASGKQPNPTALQGEYVAASRKTSSGRQRRLLGMLGSLSVLAALGAGFGFWQSRVANIALAEALEAKNAEAAQTAVAEQREQEARVAQKEAEVANAEAQKALERSETAQAAEAKQRNLAEQRTQEAQEALATADAERSRAEKGEATAQRQTQLAQQEQAISFARQLAAQAGWLQQQRLDLLPQSILLAVEAIKQLDPYSESSADATQVLQKMQLLPIEQSRIIHAGAVKDVHFSPDGRYVVTASADNTAKVLDITTHQEVARIMHRGAVKEARFSPDGRYVVTSGFDTTQVWDLDTKQTVITYDGATEDVSFSPDSRYVATASLNDVARVWRIADQEEVAQISHDGSIHRVRFSADSRYVATAGSNGVRVWDLDNNQETTRIARGPVYKLNFGSKNHLLVIAGLDGDATVWDIKNDRAAAHIPHSRAISDVSFSPDGRYVATASSDNTAAVLNFEEGKVAAYIEHGGTLKDVSFSPDSRYVAVSGEQSAVAQIWDLEKNEEVARVSHDRDIKTVQFSPNSRYVVTASLDNTARVWDITANQEVARIVHDGALEDVGFSPDSRSVATASLDNTARVWDITANQKPSPLIREQIIREQIIVDARFSPDGRYVATTGLDAVVQVRDLDTNQEVDVNTAEWAVEGNANDRYVTSIDTEGNTIRIREAATQADQEEIASISHEGLISASDLSSDGQSVATAVNNVARVWDVNTQTEVVRSTHNEAVEGIRFSPDGQYLLIRSGDVASVLDITTQTELASFGHEGIVKDVDLSLDGQYVATAVGNTARVWDVDTQAEITRITRDGAIEGVRFSPDGASLLTRSGYVAEVWFFESDDLIRAACSRLNRNLTLQEWQQFIGDSKTYEQTCSLPANISRLAETQGSTINRNSRPLTKLAVPYFNTLDNDASIFGGGWRQVNLTAHAMLADYLLQGKLSEFAESRGYSEVESVYMRVLVDYGDTVDFDAHTETLREIGIESYFSKTLSREDVLMSLERGIPVVAGFSFKTSGTVIIIVGYDPITREWLVHDSYGARVGISDQYAVTRGAFYRYSEEVMNQIFWDLGTEAGWGRIVTQVNGHNTGLPPGL